MCLGIRANVGGQQVVVCRQKSLRLRRRDNLNNLQELVPQVGSVVAVQIRLNALQDLPNMGVAHHRWGKAHASKLMVKHRLHHRVVQEGVRHSTISMQMAVNEQNVLSRGLRSQPVAKPATRQGMRSLSIHLKLLSESSLALSIKDESSIRNASEEVQLEVPRLSPDMFGSPLPVYEAIPRSTADSLPRLLARPRATVVFGQDSVLPLYLDAVGAEAPTRAHVRIMGDGDTRLFDADIELPARGGGHSTTYGVPVAKMGIGINTLLVSGPGRADTARARVFVSLGDDLPIASFDEMFAYLRYFTTADRLKTLRDATPAFRPEAWAAFLKATDPIPGTAEHEGLRDYFGRIRVANIRFRDDGPVGWQSDRGTAFVALGDPDNIVDTGMTDPNARVRQQIWEYRELRVQILFVDQTGFGRWRLSVQGRAELDNAIRRRMASRQ
jgi:GWxTD domain-containing protein